MSAIHIFKAGTHTDMHGKKLPFTPDDLAACVKAYDPSVHEAPLGIGHPRTDDPAWGWGKALSLSGVDLMAEPAQLDPQFAEMVTDGRFKKVSASFYPRIHRPIRSPACSTFAMWAFSGHSHLPSRG